MVTAISAPASSAPLDARRKLQLALGALWLFDGLLQYQPYMFSGGFPKMLAGTAYGNPAAVAVPVTWSAAFIGHHLTVSNAAFATIQVALGLGIAWRPAARLALGASVLWACGVWLLGEGLGGVLTGTASPLSGAPGAVILYAVLTLLVWPHERDALGESVAVRTAGRQVAGLTWLAVWGLLGVLALLPAARAPRGMSSLFAGMAAGEPGWLSRTDTRLAGLIGDRGLAASAVLAVLLFGVAISTFLGPRVFRVALVFGVVLAVVIWVAEGLGGIFTGTGTDPNSAPLLLLLALAFWPAAVPGEA